MFPEVLPAWKVLFKGHFSSLSFIFSPLDEKPKVYKRQSSPPAEPGEMMLTKGFIYPVAASIVGDELCPWVLSRTPFPFELSPLLLTAAWPLHFPARGASLLWALLLRTQGRASAPAELHSPSSSVWRGGRSALGNLWEKQVCHKGTEGQKKCIGIFFFSSPCWLGGWIWHWRSLLDGRTSLGPLSGPGLPNQPGVLHT